LTFERRAELHTSEPTPLLTRERVSKSKVANVRRRV
jgi:hypothetical protein